MEKLLVRDGDMEPTAVIFEQGYSFSRPTQPTMPTEVPGQKKDISCCDNLKR
jgi:hypothetical protein